MDNKTRAISDADNERFFQAAVVIKGVLELVAAPSTSSAVAGGDKGGNQRSNRLHALDGPLYRPLCPPLAVLVDMAALIAAQLLKRGVDLESVGTRLEVFGLQAVFGLKDPHFTAAVTYCLWTLRMAVFCCGVHASCQCARQSKWSAKSSCQMQQRP